MNDLTKKKIGTILNELLAEKGILQKELAEHIGVTPNTVSYYLSGDRCPDIDKIIEIANYLNVSTDYLLGRSTTKGVDDKLIASCDYTGLSEESIEKIANWTKNKHSLYIGFNWAYNNKMKTKQLDNLISYSGFDSLIESIVTYRRELYEIENDIYNITNSKIDLDVGVFDSLNEINNRFRAARCDYYDCLHKFESCIKEQTQKDYDRVDELLKDAFRSYGFNEDENGDDIVNGKHN